MKPTALYRALGLALTAAALPCAAAEEPVQTLDEVVVTADYTELELLRDTKEIITLTADTLQDHGIRTLSDALNTVTSINTNFSGIGQIDIRGQGPGQSHRNLQILFDGAPLTALMQHPMQVNYDIVPVEQIERIDIIPGGGSVMYGSGASGGIINITSALHTLEDPNLSASVEYNNRGYRADTNLGHVINEHWAVQVGANKVKRDLRFVDTFDNTEYVSAGVRWTPAPGHSLVVRGAYLSKDAQYVGSVRTDALLEQGRQYRPKWENKTVGLDENGHKIKRKLRGYIYADRRQHRLSSTYRGTLGHGFSLVNDSFYEAGSFFGTSDDDRAVADRTFGNRAKLIWNYLGRSKLLLGVDHIEQTAAYKYNDYRYIGNKKYKEVPLTYYYDKRIDALYLSNNIKYRDLTFTQGVRRELTRWSFEKTIPKLGRDFYDESRRWNTAAELAAGWQYRDDGRVYARYERGYTVPDGMQITNETVINDEHCLITTPAKDERFDLYEIGWQDSFGPVSMGVTVWQSETKNQLDRILWMGDNIMHRESHNLLNTRRRGVDVTMTEAVGPLRFEQAYSYLRGRVRYRDKAAENFLDEHSWNGTHPQFVSSGVESVPKHKATFRVVYQPTDNFTADVLYTYTGRYQKYTHTDDIDKGLVRPYSTVDISAVYQPLKWLSIRAGVTNLFNKQYYVYESGSGLYTYVAPGYQRGFFIGLKARY